MASILDDPAVRALTDAFPDVESSDAPLDLRIEADAIQFAQANPEDALAVASKPQPSRSDFAQLPGRYNGEERKAIGQMWKDLGQDVLDAFIEQARRRTVEQEALRQAQGRQAAETILASATPGDRDALLRAGREASRSVGTLESVSGIAFGPYQAGLNVAATGIKGLLAPSTQTPYTIGSQGLPAGPRADAREALESAQAGFVGQKSVTDILTSLKIPAPEEGRPWTNWFTKFSAELWNESGPELLAFLGVAVGRKLLKTASIRATYTKAINDPRMPDLMREGWKAAWERYPKMRPDIANRLATWSRNPKAANELFKVNLINRVTRPNPGLKRLITGSRRFGGFDPTPVPERVLGPAEKAAAEAVKGIGEVPLAGLAGKAAAARAERLAAIRLAGELQAAGATPKGDEQILTSDVGDAKQALFFLPPETPVPPGRMPPTDTIPNVGEPNDAPVREMLDYWLGDRQLAETKADLRFLEHGREVAATGGVQATKIGKKHIAANRLRAAMHLYIDLKDRAEVEFAKFGQALTPQQRELYALSQNLPDDVRAIADRVLAENATIGAEAKDAEVIQNIQDNYTARIWEAPSGAAKRTGAGRGLFTQKTARAKRRTLSSILEGWAGGMQLQVPDALDAQRIASHQVYQVIHDRNLVAAGTKAGIFSTRQGEEQVLIEHPNFKKWKRAANVNIEADPDQAFGVGDWVRVADRGNFGKVTNVDGDRVTVHFRNPETGTEDTHLFDATETTTAGKKAVEKVLPGGKNFIITPNGTVLERVELYADKPLAKKLNNILGRSRLFDVPGIEMLTKWNSLLKQQLLFTSFFHHQAFLRSYMLATEGLDPVAGYRAGEKAMRNFVPELQEGVHAGLTLLKVQDFDIRAAQQKTVIGEAIDRVPLAREVKDGLLALRDSQTRFLFETMGPALKSQAFLISFRTRLRANKAALEAGRITRREIAQKTAELINDDFGGLNLQRLGRNPTQQHIFRLLALAPDWTESNIRSMAKMFEQPGDGVTPAAAAEGRKVARAMWGRILLKAGGATIAANLVLAGFDDDSFWDRYQKAWKTGWLRWLDVDITPIYRALGGDDEKRKYFSILGHFRDPIKFLSKGTGAARSKLSVLGRFALEGATGRDWRDARFTTVAELLGIDDPERGRGGKFKGQLTSTAYTSRRGPVKYSEIPSFLTREGKGTLPIQMQAALDFLAGHIDAFDAITRSLGLMTGGGREPEDLSTQGGFIFQEEADTNK